MSHLGLTVTDKITGFTGLVIGKVDYLTGCSQLLVQPNKLTSDDNVIESRWFDVQRVEVLNAPVVQFNNGATPGADKPAPRR